MRHSPVENLLGTYETCCTLFHTFSHEQWDARNELKLKRDVLTTCASFGDGMCTYLVLWLQRQFCQGNRCTNENNGSASPIKNRFTLKRSMNPNLEIPFLSSELYLSRDAFSDSLKDFRNANASNYPNFKGGIRTWVMHSVALVLESCDSMSDQRSGRRFIHV